MSPDIGLATQWGLIGDVRLFVHSFIGKQVIPSQFLAYDSMRSALAYAIACPFVCHTGGSVKNGRSYDYYINFHLIVATSL